MAKPIFDLCYGRKYQKNGETKTAWQKCGAVFESEKGMSAMIEMMPVGAAGPIWLSMFPIKDKNAPADDGGDNVPY